VRSEWPEPESRPRRRDGSSAVPLDDNLAVYDDVGQLLILLNVAAAAVWTRCDGVATFDQIVADVASSHAGDIGEITEDVWLTVRRLAELGLVDDVVEDSADSAGPAQHT
jgi:hypothetical protein